MSTRDNYLITREGFLRKNIVAVLFFKNCAIYSYSDNCLTSGVSIHLKSPLCLVKKLSRH